MGSIRFSLRTFDPSEVKARQGQAAATLETFWTALRRSRPTTLTHRQATALAGDLYRGWAEDRADGTIAVVHTPQGWRRDYSTPDEEAAGFGVVLSKLDAAIEAGDAADHEPTLGPLVTRLLLERGISEVDEASRMLLLGAFAKALRDTLEVRKRHAEGDYSPDPKADRFPEFEPPVAAPPKTPSPPSPKASLTTLVADWWTERKAAGLKPSAVRFLGLEVRPAPALKIGAQAGVGRIAGGIGVIFGRLGECRDGEQSKAEQSRQEAHGGSVVSLNEVGVRRRSGSPQPAPASRASTARVRSCQLIAPRAVSAWPPALVRAQA